MGDFICEVPVFFATTEGQTRRIAERLASALVRQGFTSRAIDMASPEAANLDWAPVVGALAGASLHGGKHQRVARRFLRHHHVDLNHVPSAFFSVSLSAASTNPDEVHAAEDLARRFPPDCGWTPTRIVSIAGRLAYSEYGFFIRWVMKRIARKEGAPTDTSRDYELTNWDAVDALAGEMADAIRGRVTMPVARRGGHSANVQPQGVSVPR